MVTVTIIPDYTPCDERGEPLERVPAHPAGPVLTADEVMAVLRLWDSSARFPRQSFERLRRQYDDVLRPFQVGKHVRFRLDDVLQFVARLQEDNLRISRPA